MSDECSICLSEINTKTGGAQLSCSHRFHVGCIGRWILKNESCPCCRHEMCSEERIAEDTKEDEESEDEDYDADDDEDLDDEQRALYSHWRHEVDMTNKMPIPQFDEEANALWAMRQTFERLEQGQSIAAIAALAANAVVNMKEQRLRENAVFFNTRESGYESA